MARRFVVLVGAAALVASCAPSGNPEQEGQAGAAADATVIMSESLAQRVEILEGKLVSLAEAMPEDSYAWRPMDGVRSVGDVYAHVAADNWFLLVVMGDEVPPETGVTTDVATLSAYEENAGSKADIVAGLKASFTALRAALDGDRGAMDRQIDLGHIDAQQTGIAAGDLWVRAIVHLHEHLGQSIAYARSNEVVPPWSGPGS